MIIRPCRVTRPYNTPLIMNNALFTNNQSSIGMGK